MSADPTFPGFVMSDEEEDARLAMQDTDFGVLSRGLAHVAPPPLDPMQMPLEELERLSAMEQLSQFDTPQVDYSAIPNYPAQAAQRHEGMVQLPPGVEPSRNFLSEAADYTIDAMAAKVPQGVKDFEPLTFMSGRGLSGQPYSPSLGQAAQMIFPQSSEEIPYEFLPFDELAGLLKHAPDMNAAMVKAFHGTRREAAQGIAKRGFDPTKIGSGEGAQAFGYGHYFAENPGVAHSYKMAEDPVNEIAAGALERNGMDLRKAISDLDESLAEIPDGPLRNEMGDALNRLLDADSVDEVMGGGALLDIEIDVEPEDLLDWDLPLSEQPPKVREALEGLADKAKDDFAPMTDLRGMVVDSTGSTRLASFNSETADGASIHALLELVYGSEGASEALREAGIPGLRFLDQGSRKAGMKALSKPFRIKARDGDSAVASYATREAAEDHIAKSASPELFEIETVDNFTRNIVIFPGGEDLIHPKNLDGLPIAPKEIVGENAKDLVFYHGGGADLGPGDTLDPSAAIQSRAQFASAKRGVAEEFAGMADESGGTGRVVEVRIDKEAVVERAEYWQLNDDDYLDAARERGVDVLYTDSADAGAPGIAVLNNHVVRVPE